MDLLEDERLKLFSDACLRTEDGYTFHIHKVWLAKNSKYFYEIFCNSKGNSNNVLIPHVKGKVMESILSFLYTGKIEITKENIIGLMEASYDMDLSDLNLHEKMFVKMNLSLDNCIDIYITAKKINRYDILQDCYRYLQVNFERIIYSRNKQFEKLDLESFLKLLKDRNLCVSSEKVVHFAIVEYVKQDLKSCLPLMPELLSCLALSDVNESLATEILEHDTLSTNPSCEDILFMRYFYHTASNLQVLSYYIEDQEVTPFYDHRLPSVLNFIAKYCIINGTKAVQIYLTYDDKFDLWRKILETDLECNKVVCAGNGIYFFETIEDTIFRYNFLEKEWVEVNEIRIERSNYDVVVSEEQIYVLGGISTITEEELYDVEIYNTLFNVWYRTTSMLPITCYASAALNDSIYVIGYKSYVEKNVMVAQVYDKRAATWKMLPEVSVKRTHFALVVYCEKIYVIGGINGNRLLRDVEVFDPLKNEWKKEANLPYTYNIPEAVIVNHLLIVYDNDLRDREYLQINPPVFWNIDKRCWERFGELSSMNNLHLYRFFSIEETKTIQKFTKENRHPSTHFEKSPFF